MSRLAGLGVSGLRNRGYPGANGAMRMPIPHLPQLPPPIWRESRVPLETAALLRDPIYNGDGVRSAGGQPVLLIPGFLAGDDSLGFMTKWLRRTGHRTRSAGIKANVDCSGKAVDRLLERTEALAERHGRRVVLIGQSRGGTFARVMAVNRPDLISGIITLGSPLTSTFDLHPMVRMNIRVVGALGTVGAPGMFSLGCLKGECCDSFRHDLQAPFPEDVGFVSIYSKSDGIVRWRACLDDAAKHVEVNASHIGMAVNPGAYRAMATALDRFRRQERKRAAAGIIPMPTAKAA
jgi:triacylglycerol lipase